MRIVVTGATGQLGRYLVDELRATPGNVIEPWGRSPGPDHWKVPVRQLDLTDPNSLALALARSNPDAIIHAAAVSSAEGARRDPTGAWALNVSATASLARWCHKEGRRLVFTSTDMVFDGDRGWYREEDPPAPILEYGRTKAAAETVVAEAPDGLVVRLSLLYGPSRTGRPSFYDRCLGELREDRPQCFFRDEFRTPLDYVSAARVLVRLTALPIAGIVHVGGRERLSRFELMSRAAAATGLDTRLISANRRADVASAEPRPADLSLETTRLESLLPGLVPSSVEESLAGLN